MTAVTFLCEAMSSSTRRAVTKATKKAAISVERERERSFIFFWASYIPPHVYGSREEFGLEV